MPLQSLGSAERAHLVHVEQHSMLADVTCSSATQQRLLNSANVYVTLFTGELLSEARPCEGGQRYGGIRHR